MCIDNVGEELDPFSEGQLVLCVIQNVTDSKHIMMSITVSLIPCIVLFPPAQVSVLLRLHLQQWINIYMHSKQIRKF